MRDRAQLTDPAAGSVINWATMCALGLGNLVAINEFERASSARSARAARTASLMTATGIVILFVPLAAVSWPRRVCSATAPPTPRFSSTPRRPGADAHRDAGHPGSGGGLAHHRERSPPGDLNHIECPVLHARMLRAIQLLINPAAAIGILVALRVHHTAILLSLIFGCCARA